MTLEEKETLNKFVNVNESFLLAIKNNRSEERRVGKEC